MSAVLAKKNLDIEQEDLEVDVLAESYCRGFRRCLALRQDTSDGKYSDKLREALRTYFQSYGLLEHPRFPEWWDHHLGSRGAHAFNVFIPWLEELAGSLDGKTILEIGCGTGSSTVALAAHAHSVTACDIHLPSLETARIRLIEDGLAHKVKLLTISPGLDELTRLRESFDVIVLYGVLEHMLPEERTNLFRTIWDLLRIRGQIVLYETPNRLFLTDRHTTGLFGWSWLPPNWALRYGKWRGAFDESTDLAAMYRLGFGMTYWGLKDLLQSNEIKYEIRSKYVGGPVWRRAWLKLLTTFLRAPQCAFAENINLVIEKLETVASQLSRGV